MAAKTVDTMDESDISLFQEFLAWRQLQKNASRSTSDDGTCGMGNCNLEEMPPCASDEGARGEGSSIVSDKYTNQSDVSPPVVQMEDVDNTSTPDLGKNGETAVQSSTTQLQQKRSFTADEYLSTDKKFSEAKKIFRHALKLGAQETKIWNSGKISTQLTPAERSHIHKLIIAECPALKGHTREIDIVLSKSLSERKYYLIKKGLLKKKPRNKCKKQCTSKSGGSPEGKMDGVHIEGSSSGSNDQLDGTGATQTVYEQEIESRKELNKAVLAAVKNPSTKIGPGSFSPGDDVVVTFHDDVIGTGVFISYVNDMFCKVGFFEHICDDPEDELDDVHLPQTIPPNLKTNRKMKTMFYELEKDDMFQWKIERIKKNASTKGYIVGNPPKKDIFKDVVLKGKRVPKRKYPGQ